MIVKSSPITIGVGRMLHVQIHGVTVRSYAKDQSKVMNIVIRGNGSKGGKIVISVVDGVPGANYIIDEIESVVILKDTASAAIYGAHSGSSGVILITTKKAKASKTQISYDGNYSFSNAINLTQSLAIEEECK
jgi:TonB-dependent SusC/RagA subfamily outer membrane receptor